MKPARLKLMDNHYGAPGNNGLGWKTVSLQRSELSILEKYSGKRIAEWHKLGVPILSDYDPAGNERDDDSRNLSFFTLDRDNNGNTPQTWINTHNCMGVVRLHDKASGAAVQIEIGSRFDKGSKPFFLTYLLSKVFGGSIVDLVDLGKDSLWDLLLAFLFRRRLLAASAIGLFKHYQTFGHNDTRIRGRIDVNEHLRRNIPFRGTVAYATHEITFDNPTNHLIRYALEKVRRKWPGCLLGDHRLTETEHQLEQGTPTWQQGGVMACIRHKENRTPVKHPYFGARYEPLRQASLAILRDEGAGLYQQHQEAEGVIFDGSWLWEEYLWTLLEPLGFEHPENKNKKGAWKPLDTVSLYPDFFHRKKRAILDAKYKGGDPSPEDAKQVFAYMFLLDAVHGGLIKPDGSPKARSRINRECKDAEPSSWHNIVLSPPQAAIAKEFKDAMGAEEEKFCKALEGLEVDWPEQMDATLRERLRTLDGPGANVCPAELAGA